MSTPAVQRKPHPKNKFTIEEDIYLRKLVAQFGENNWQQVARHMEKRNPRQCKERWHNYLSPMVRNAPWQPEEDELLLAKVGELGQRWVRIAKFFPMRTDINIKNRYLVLKRRSRKEPEPAPQNPDPGPFLIGQNRQMQIPPLITKRPPIPPKKLGVIEPQQIVFMPSQPLPRQVK